jgi:signal transduction histidine kinase
MPALAKSPARLPRFVPHVRPNLSAGANAGAGSFSKAISKSERADQLAHDARNVLSGLMLYCDLLSAPGVLARQHGHYAQELESIVKNAAQIVERMALAQNPASISPSQTLPAASFVPLPVVPVTDAAEELCRLQPLLAAIAGPAIKLSIATMPCAGRTALAVEDFTRILVNLVRNAADAMPSGGHIRITTQYGDGFSFLNSAHASEFGEPRDIVLAIADNGPGIPESLRERVFDLGFSTHQTQDAWPAPRRRGLGLSIVRNLVEAAGGTVHIPTATTCGARFEISLPITSGTYPIPLNSAFPADSRVKGCIECQ